MTNGWICVHRKLLEWEWFDDHNTFRLFMYLMLKANHQDKNWKGIQIKRGQHITSLDKIASGSGLTKSQVRTSLNKLKSTHEIAHHSNAQHTVITVVNYDSYQASDTQNDTLVTRESHTNDIRMTPNNNDNNDNNDKKVNNKDSTPAIAVDYSALQMTDDELKELKRIRKKCKGGALTQRVINGLAKEFNTAVGIGYSYDEILTEWETRGWKSFKAEWMKPKQSNNGLSALTQKNIQNTQGDW